mmetsp:Transcript_79690/g.251900  ORF Transcript_79690/g.251900 Transcript_79690/m.251900 type:complete len:305 (+) Transcript_79690:277-1191(+)
MWPLLQGPLLGAAVAAVCRQVGLHMVFEVVGAGWPLGTPRGGRRSLLLPGHLRTRAASLEAVHGRPRALGIGAEAQHRSDGRLPGGARAAPGGRALRALRPGRVRGHDVRLLPLRHAGGPAGIPGDGQPPHHGGSPGAELCADLPGERPPVLRVPPRRAPAGPRRAGAGGPPRGLQLRGARQVGGAGGDRAVRGLVLPGQGVRARLHRAVAGAPRRTGQRALRPAPRGARRGCRRNRQRVGGVAEAHSAEIPSTGEPLLAFDAEPGRGGREGKAGGGGPALRLGGGAPPADGLRQPGVPALGAA